MNDMNKKRAIHYFQLGEQYAEAANVLLQTLIDNDNSNAGFGLTEKEVLEDLVRNVCNSDMSLFIPALFNILQSTELFAKGLILLNNLDIDGTHDMQNLLANLKNTYGEKSKIYQEFRNIYFSQEEILEKYRKENNITNTKDLYESLRYPESKNGKKYEYQYIICNGDNGIELFEKLYNSIKSIKTLVLDEYHRLCPKNGTV